MRSLTDKQALILHSIIVYIQDNGFPPTLREIGERFNITSTNCVKDHLRAIQRKGYILVTDYQPRAIKVLRMTNGEPTKLRFFIQRTSNDERDSEHQGHEGLSDSLGG